MDIETHRYHITTGPNEEGFFVVPSVPEIPERYHGVLVHEQIIQWYTSKPPEIEYPEDWDTIMYI